MKSYFLFILILGYHLVGAQTVIKADINLDTKHEVGGISEFDRSKFITIHSDQQDREWVEDRNFTNDLLADFMDQYDVYFGRSTGGITWIVNQVREDASRSGFADPSDIRSRGTNSRNNYENVARFKKYEARNQNFVIGAQQHPFYPEGTLTRPNPNASQAEPWAFSTADTPTEPFGLATGEYMGHYLKEFFSFDPTQNGQPAPAYVEVMNEPLYDLTTIRLGKPNFVAPEEVFRFHNGVAQGIKSVVPEAKVGGYTAAFPDFEKDNFNRWKERDQLFMDIAGANMDFWSIHLYDFASINGGKKLLRSGSNVEATFDMMDHYSQLSFNEIKPYIISEYGAVAHDYLKKPWSQKRDWLLVKSMSSLLMSFLERPNTIGISIPFVIPKAKWGTPPNQIDGVNEVYNHRLMRLNKELGGATGNTAEDDTWVYTDLVKFYQLWSDVKGTRVDTWASDLDIQLDAYVDGKKAYIIVNNLTFASASVGLHMFGIDGNTISKAIGKHLFNQNDVATLTTTDITGNYTVSVAPEATMILEVEFENDIEIDNTSQETKYFADRYFQPIVANAVQSYTINDITTGNFGEAILRLGLGRNHNQSLRPTVSINGQTVTVPSDWRGYDQKDKERFFGVLEIPVPYDILTNGTNTVSVTFSETGGHVSSLALQVFNFDTEINRDTESALSNTQFDSTLSTQVRIAPNPTTSTFEVLLPPSIPSGEISIYTLNGRLVQYDRVDPSNSSISLKSLAPGLYLLVGKTDAGHFQKKISKL